MFQSSDPKKKRFLKLTDYIYESAVKDFKSFFLQIRTLIYSDWPFLTRLLKKSITINFVNYYQMNLYKENVTILISKDLKDEYLWSLLFSLIG